MKTMRSDILNWPFAVCLGLLVAAPLYCLRLNPYPDVLLQDQWRMAPLALDYYAGTFRVADLFAPHYDVSILFYKALFLLNAVFLKLNMPVEFVVGMFFVFIYSCVVLFAIHRGHRRRRKLPLLLLPVLFTIYSQRKTRCGIFRVGCPVRPAFAACRRNVFFLDKFLPRTERPRHALFSLLCLGASGRRGNHILLYRPVRPARPARAAMAAPPRFARKTASLCLWAIPLCLLAGGLQILYTRILWPT
jgi:hypothetical protein